MNEQSMFAQICSSVRNLNNGIYKIYLTIIIITNV